MWFLLHFPLTWSYYAISLTKNYYHNSEWVLHSKPSSPVQLPSWYSIVPTHHEGDLPWNESLLDSVATPEHHSSKSHWLSWAAWPSTACWSGSYRVPLSAVNPVACGLCWIFPGFCFAIGEVEVELLALVSFLSKLRILKKVLPRKWHYQSLCATSATFDALVAFKQRLAFQLRPQKYYGNFQPDIDC